MPVEQSPSPQEGLRGGPSAWPLMWLNPAKASAMEPKPGRFR